MKKMISLVVVTTLMFLWPYHPSTAYHQLEKGKPAAFFYYTWYLDEDMQNPTGTESTINTEMERLRDVYSGNVFSSSPSLGLTEYEYGYFMYYPAAIIYSDLPYQLNRNQGSASTVR